jgi:hypothetical protein
MYRSSYVSDQKQKLIDVIAARTGTPRSELAAKTVQELETILDESFMAQVRAEAQNSPAAIEADQKLADLSRERQYDHAFFNIFRTAINNRVAIDNQTNRNIIVSWVQEDQGEALSPELFKKILTEQPQLAGHIVWQSADVLDPKKRRQAAAAQAAEDRKTFSDAARKYGLGDTEANFHLVRETLGEGFSEYAVGDAVRNGTVQVSPATEAELEQYRQKAQEQRQQFLRNADPETLRSIVRSEAEQRRIKFQHDETERQIAHREMLDAQVGFPVLPEFNSNGEKIDAAYLIRISNTNLQLFKTIISRFGAANVTARLRGIR